MSNDAVAETLDLLLKNLQAKTPNGGGYYHFSTLPIACRGAETLRRDLIGYFRKFEAYASTPYGETNHPLYRRELDPDCLAVKLMEHPVPLLRGKLDFWNRHQNSSGTPKAFDPGYPEAEAEFFRALNSFLVQSPTTAFYQLENIDTAYAVGKDQVNDDVLIVTPNKLYVLHLGWSS